MKTFGPDQTVVAPAILIVDDLPQNLLALEATLESLGVELIRAQSGEEALRQLLEREFALIILDVQMPGLNGLETAELIKKRERSSHIPIIFITALSREAAYVFKGYGQGAVDYLLKPVDPEIVRAKASVFVELFRRGEQIKQQAKLVAAGEAKDAFLAAIAHELRTPLTAAKAQAQLAIRQMGGAESPAVRPLHMISRQIDRLVRMVEELFDLTRLQSGSFRLYPAPLDLMVLANEVAERMASTSAKHRVVVTGPDTLAITADADRVDQILTNLIANGIRYSPEGGEVRVELHHDESSLHLKVTDRGVGIAPDKLQTIFERFAQLHGGTYGGLGLGLTISQELVVRHGGKIWAESTGRPGEGSTLHVVLPLHPPVEPGLQAASGG
ncbi:MAG: hybrid sensor histidine kinase/response regulator [Myxococcota bacterium]|nr:hybrid sensor histidine kinase/response regulator [Myxococcota bacterium]